MREALALLHEARHHVARQQIGGRHAQDKIDAEDWLRRYKELNMAQYKVWDSLNGEEETAEVIEAFDPAAAAELYAEGDVDGNIDGCYEHGCQVKVLHVSTGVVKHFVVYSENQPVFRAAKVDLHPEGDGG